MKESEYHPSQRGYFAGELYNQMEKDEDIILLVGDLGYKVFDRHFEKFPERCINVGAAEQAMVGIAVGLALEGKKPFTYTISSFYLRAAETIHLYLNHEQIPVRLIGSGRNDDYEHDGISHDARALQIFLRQTSLIQYYPINERDVPNIVRNMVRISEPSFISLKR